MPSDPYEYLRELLPKLARPSWVHLIGLQIRPEAPVIAPEKAAEQKKDLRNRYRRLAKAARGIHVRNRARVT